MKKAATVGKYLAMVPPKPRAALRKLHRAIKAAAPGATEGISYGIPAFWYRGRILVYYAAFKNHCSFFPASLAVVSAHKHALEPYQTAKGTIRFAPEKPLTDTLVKKMVKARLAEHRAKWPEA